MSTLTRSSSQSPESIVSPFLVTAVVKEVSLHGRKMVGRDVDLPQGYRGMIMGKLNQQMGYLNIDGSGAEKVDFEALAEFSQVTEWQKDAWSAEKRGFTSNLVDYLVCARILHAEE